MGTNECSQSASKSSWDSQDFGDLRMVLKMVHFRKSTRPQWVKYNSFGLVMNSQMTPAIRNPRLWVTYCVCLS